MKEKTMNAAAEKGLDSARVLQIYTTCLLGGSENISGVSAEGISGKVAFHPERLVRHKAEIEAMLDELPWEFKMSGGGGFTFLHACYDKHGNQWTSLHFRMEQLFLLGIAIGKVECQVPRKLWPFLPGGMPYYVVN